MPLRELLDTSIGGIWGKEAGADELNVRVWRVTELKPGGRLEPTTAARRSISKRQYEARALKIGDLLLEKSGGGPTSPVGRVGLVTTVPEPAICSNFMQLLRPRPDRAEPRFLHLYLNHLQASGGTARLQTASTNIRNIKASAYVELEVPLPSLEEQRRIVAILEDHLSRLDAAESAAASASRRLAALRERIVIDAITGAEIGTRNAAELAAVGTHDGDLPALPRGWDWARLGEVADVVGGVTKDAKKQGDPSFVEVPYLRVANVQRGHLKLDDVAMIRVAPAKAAALALQPGDVLLNEGGDRDKLARGWVWEGQIDDCIHQNHVFRARIHEARLDPYFLSWTANTLGGRWAERNGKQSVNLASISLRMIRNMPVIVPPVGAASEIVRRLHDQFASFDRIEAAEKAARGRSAALRRSLLAAAFSGKLTSGRETTASEELQHV